MTDDEAVAELQWELGREPYAYRFELPALNRLIAARQRALHVLLELQAMAAEKYEMARWHYADVVYLLREDLDETSACAWAAVRQLDAAAISKLVRIGLGIEEP